MAKRSVENEDGAKADGQRAAVEGSTQSLSGLYRKHNRELHQFVLGILRDRADADETIQQVFLKLLDAGESIRTETARGWLFTVAYREAMNVLRRRNLDDEARARLWARPAWQAGREAPDPERDSIREEAVEQVRRALRELPGPQRDVVERRLYGNQTFASIAQDLGCPLGTVLTRMRAGLVALRRLLPGSLNE